MLMRVAVGIHMEDIDSGMPRYLVARGLWLRGLAVGLVAAACGLAAAACCCGLRAGSPARPPTLPPPPTLPRPRAAVETYHLLSQRWFTHASPTLFNAGTPRPQLSSCFLVCMKNDSIEGAPCGAGQG